MIEILLGGVSWVYCLLMLVGAIRSVAYRRRLVWLRVFPPIRGSPMRQRADCKVMLSRVAVLLGGLFLGGPLFSFWLGVYPGVVLRVFNKFVGLLVLICGVVFCRLWMVEEKKKNSWFKDERNRL